MDRAQPAGPRRRQSQSPSLRGSGRFGERTIPPGSPTFPSLNPLHCGAVVASARASADVAEARVSIPFIAGQWSLRLTGAGARKGSRRVSIPFIAGQWSLVMNLIAMIDPVADRLNPLHCGAVVASPRPRAPVPLTPACLNPLHCGAVVASPRTTPFPFCRVLLRNTRPACDHVLCARLHVWPKPVIIP